jgi:D-psicose/D-tagatose/L-ribulose 3-epimerase
MKQSASIGMLREHGLEGAFQTMQRLGFDGVELTVVGFLPPDQTPPQRCHEIRRMASDLGLEIPGVHGAMPQEGHRFLGDDPAERQAAHEYMLRVIDMVAEMGARVVTLGMPGARNIPPGVSRETGWKRAVEAFRAWGEYAAPHGVTVSLEILNRYETNIGLTMGEGNRLMAEAQGVGLSDPTPGLGITPDTYHMNIDEDPYREAIFKNVVRIAHMHTGDGNRQPPGQGNFPFRTVLAALHDAGYTGYLSLELPRVYYGVAMRYDPETALRMGREYLANILAEVTGAPRKEQRDE